LTEGVKGLAFRGSSVRLTGELDWNTYSNVSSAAVRPARAAPDATDRADKKRVLLRKRVIEAALYLFAERGYHGTTIPSVMARAGVGAGSLYRLFDGKEALVNAVFRDAKRRFEAALRGGLDPELTPRELFEAFWARLAAFSRAEPVAFRFLELQDHTPYLDGESRGVELGVLAPVLLACVDFQRRGVFRSDVPPDATIALVWGAFVGLVKAERLGYLKLDQTTFAAARDACWRALVDDGTSHRMKE
jgi:TetR/AcrR family transcriptional regulator, repressor of fatR-cypB operon